MKKNTKSSLLKGTLAAFALTLPFFFAGCPSNDSGNGGDESGAVSVKSVKNVSLAESGATTPVTDEASAKKALEELFSEGLADLSPLTDIFKDIGESVKSSSNKSVRAALSEDDIAESFESLNKQGEKFSENIENFEDASIDWALSDGNIEKNGVTVDVSNTKVKLNCNFLQKPTDTDNKIKFSLSGNSSASVSALADFTKAEEPQPQIVKGFATNIAYNASISGTASGVSSDEENDEKTDTSGDEDELIPSEVKSVSGSAGLSVATSVGFSFVTSEKVGGKLIADFSLSASPSVSSVDDLKELMEAFSKVLSSEEVQEAAYNELNLPLSGKVKIAFYDDNGGSEYVYKETSSNYEVYKLFRTSFEKIMGEDTES